MSQQGTYDKITGITTTTYNDGSHEQIVDPANDIICTARLTTGAGTEKAVLQYSIVPSDRRVADDWLDGPDGLLLSPVQGANLQPGIEAVRLRPDGGTWELNVRTVYEKTRGT